MKFTEGDIVTLIAKDDNTEECGFELGKDYKISEVHEDEDLWFDTDDNNDLCDTAWQNPNNFQLKQPIYEIY